MLNILNPKGNLYHNVYHQKIKIKTTKVAEWALLLYNKQQDLRQPEEAINLWAEIMSMLLRWVWWKNWG